MSLGPTYVYADDDNFYKDASIVGTDFFICFDEDEPPELVMKKKGRERDTLIRKAKEILEELKITATIKEEAIAGYESHRYFGNVSNVHRAFSLFLNITEPIPRASITEHEGLYTGIGEGTFECFGKTSPEKWRKDHVKVTDGGQHRSPRHMFHGDSNQGYINLA